MKRIDPLTTLPVLATELIAELDQTFPDRCPTMANSDREVWFNAGRRSVVNFLLDLLARESRGVLE